MNAVAALLLLLFCDLGPGDFRANVLEPGSFVATVQDRRTVTVYSMTWCLPCAQMKAAVGSGNAALDVRWVTGTPPNGIPAVFPTATWTDSSGKLWYSAGYKTTAQLESLVGQNDPLPVAATDPAAAPTPHAEVERVLALLPKPEVGFVDWGSGDGRWCIAAARRWNCRVTGVERDPARAAASRERVRAEGLSHLVTIITGDVLTTDVEADVGVAYMYEDTLAKLRPRIERLKAFASYQHKPPGLSVVQSGDSWIYTRPAPVAAQARTAVWGGQTYSGPVCNNARCGMCNSIRAQLGQ